MKTKSATQFCTLCGCWISGVNVRVPCKSCCWRSKGSLSPLPSESTKAEQAWPRAADKARDLALQESARNGGDGGSDR